MLRIVAFALVAALSLQTTPLFAAQLVVGGQTATTSMTGSITGTAVNPAGQPLANLMVRARDLVTGQVAGSTTSSAAGQFTFVGLKPGSYVIEIADSVGRVVGTSAFISIAAGTALVNTVVVASTGVLAAATTAGTTALAGTALAVRAVAAAGGLTGVIAPPAITQASPSR